MNQTALNLKQIRPVSMRLGAVTGVLLVLGLILAGHAFAAYEEVGIFSGSLTPPVEPGVFPEEVQLGGVSGMAVNVSGAGGVAPGTVYTVMALPELEVRVARFEPESDGKLKFVERWAVLHKKGEYERCGPVLHTSCAAIPSEYQGSDDIDVDQATGNVYVYSVTNTVPDTLITEFSPDGSKEIARFGELAANNETTAASPEKIHSTANGGIAVNDSGDVYVVDVDGAFANDDFYHRLMEFVPQSPGDYEHYIYAGKSHDVGAGSLNESKYPTLPVVDSAGDIFVAGETYVEEYPPTGGAPGPVCSVASETGGITAMTVNPDSGEVFYYSAKNKEVHRLGACSSEGKFVELESLGVSPERAQLFALAFDPVRQFVPSRAPGVLSGGAPGPIPTSGGKGEPGQSALGYMFAQVEENPPVVGSGFVSAVTGTSGELHASVNPKGSATRYVFQYVTDVVYKEHGESFAGGLEAPVGGALFGNGRAGNVAVVVSGLSPGTAYDFRVVATSNCSTSEPTKVCEGVGAAHGFQTFPVEGGGLPDGRVFELVSPIDKNGGQVFPAEPLISSCGEVECKPGAAYARFPMQSAPDGEAVVYEGSPFSPGEGAVIENEYLSHRTGAGWQTTDLTPPLLESKSGEGYKAFDTGLTQGLLAQTSPSLSPEAPSEYDNLYLQPTGTPTSVSPLLSAAPPNRVSGTDTESLRLTFAGASTDLSRMFFTANDALTPEATGGPEAKNNLYESVDGGLRSVNILPGQAETTPGAMFGSGPRGSLSHAISGDGNRVFWSSESGQVYMRESGERTVEIPDHAGRFLAAAAADGSKVLLSDGHVYGHLKDESPVLEVDLTGGKGGFQGMVGQSDDLSHIYFIDTEALSEEANDQGDKAQSGNDNLYFWHEGVTVFVATLLSQDNGEGVGDWGSSPSSRTAEASPDGEWVAFRSTVPLRGYDNIGPCGKIELVESKEVFPNGPCAEAFLYSAATGKLTCVSCGPSGAAPLGPAHLAVLVGGGGTLAQPSYLTNTGRLYFDTQDSLVPADVNHGVEDVYEYEPDGVGTCARVNGCVSLISAGTGKADSNFLTMDSSGKNVFFTTRDQLVRSDKDELVDLYDAREGGAAESEPEAKGCGGETCAGPSVGPPAEIAPGSFVFSAAGNLLAPAPVGAVAKRQVKTVTRAQQLARALKACKKQPKKKRRLSCERTARKRYHAKASAKRVPSSQKAGR